ncbi:hypothetical protein DXX93_12600 [Thalassotalea euphylliae]|uniref:DUF3718 domain-containing protein n=1 Tax=Thalassotalea euphylliae TaxID=1655234 RepID=A0A3E0TSF3_9GAMM|nr:hypothetical protein [Thalassotalea euphylliae]REL27320.1 hypothetical protein DXX93_12600 [Thalassotalea euphylliae]
MIKHIVAVVATVVVSQSAVAGNDVEGNDKIWQCVDKTTLAADQACVAATIAQNHDNAEFFNQLANQTFETKRDALATVTYFPKRSLIEVKSLEDKATEVLMASR